MEQIEVGEYVRTDKGTIAKITEPEFEIKYKIIDLKPKFLHCLSEIDHKYQFEEITKHSKNIIDLIEVGDYVNGQLIHNKYGNPKNGELMIIYSNGKHFDNEHIKTILTHEQYESNCYKLER